MVRSRGFPGALAGLCLAFGAWAQGPDAPPGASPDQGAAAGKGQGFVLPPAVPGPGGSAAGPATFTLREVRFRGNRVFADSELRALAADWLGRSVNLYDLEDLRLRLTRHYVDRGYVNSGAVLAQGSPTDAGVVVFEIREGRLAAIRVQGSGRLDPGYVAGRLWPDPERVFNTDALQERFQMLLQDPLIERMDGRLLPGPEPGAAHLHLTVERGPAQEFFVGTDNHRPPSTGAERAYLQVFFRDVTGAGDTLDLSASSSSGAREYDLGYALPLTHGDTRLSLRASRDGSALVEEPLADLDIESRVDSLSVALSHPLRRSPHGHLRLALGLDWRRGETRLLGEPFSFSPGAEDGRSRVTVLRFSQDWVQRSASRALAVHSVFSRGLDAMGATVHGDGRPDGRFTAWLGQVQYAHRLGDGGARVVLRAGAQIASDDLLPLERFAVGGASSVRGYRENRLVRDNGYLASAELRYPVWQGEEGARLHLAPFMDFGTAWNEDGEALDQRLHSAGLGLVAEYRERLRAELYLARDLEGERLSGDDDLQDRGVHFHVRVRL